MPKGDSNVVKEERVEDDNDYDDKSIASTFAKHSKRSSSKGNAAPKLQHKVKKVESKVKKEEEDDDFEGSATSKASKKTGSKGTKKKKKNEEEVEKTKKRSKSSDNKEVTKRERKVFDLPGQKRDTPEESDPLRKFYESMYKQVPQSEMAAIWMMESGLLPKEEAKKVFERKQKRAQQQKLSSPMKTVTTIKMKSDSATIENKSTTIKRKSESATIGKKSITSSASTQKKKTPESRKCWSEDGGSNDDSDDDFVLGTIKSKKRTPSS